MPNKLMLTDAQRRSLRQQIRRGTDMRVYTRALALMELWRGRSVHAVAQMLQVHRATVDNWRKRYLSAGALAQDAPRPTGPWTSRGVDPNERQVDAKAALRYNSRIAVGALVAEHARCYLRAALPLEAA